MMVGPDSFADSLIFIHSSTMSSCQQAPRMAVLCFLCMCALASAQECKGLPPPPSYNSNWPTPEPTGSSTLLKSDCVAWQQVFDAMQGQEWEFGCASNRNDPCGCRYKVSLEGGVYCTRNRIVQINLHQMSGYRVKGSPHIDSAVGDLTELTMFNVQQNFLVGTLPESFKKLTKLDYFFVAFNHMDGKVPALPFISQYTKRCDLGGDNKGLNPESSGNNFGCPMPPGAVDCNNTYDGDMSVRCRYCLPGNGCSQLDCGPASHFNVSKDNPKCKPCSVGQYAAGSAVYDPSISAQAAYGPCQPCAKGHFANTTEQASCSLCPSGKYQPDMKQASCSNTTCLPGKAAPAGAIDKERECEDCKAGKFSPGGASPCESCGCPPGNAGTGPAAVSKTACNCSACAAGTYSTGGASQCTAMACPAGTASTASAATDSINTCTPCAANTFGLGNSSQCEACPAGQSAGVGAKQCSSPKLAVGEVAGIVIGALAGLALVIFGVNTVRKRRLQAYKSTFAADQETRLLGQGGDVAQMLSVQPDFADTCYLCGGAMKNKQCRNCGAVSHLLGTSNIGKYKIGQYVTGMGTHHDISGHVASLVPRKPGATSGQGAITVFGPSSKANASYKGAGQQTIVAAAARGEASGTGLVGRRVDIAGKGQGKITAVKKSFGKTTRHVIRFSNGVCEELVLSKEAGRAGAKGHHFHLLD